VFASVTFGDSCGISGVKGGLDARSGSMVYQPHWLNTVVVRTQLPRTGKVCDSDRLLQALALVGKEVPFSSVR
jgi:hypothetical protein